MEAVMEEFYRSLAQRLRAFALTARSAVARLEILRIAREIEQHADHSEADAALSGDKPTKREDG
jgi:hypothetical protein